MSASSDRNWLFAVLRMKMPVVLILTFLTASGVALFSLLFSPVYSARTILALDAEIIKTVGQIATSPLPAITNSDYIRYEFFMSHSLELMRLPQIARKVINTESIKDNSGSPLDPEQLVSPSLFGLLFKNNGVSVSTSWITDTQTFAIIGTSKDPDQAVRLSRGYAEAFLEENANQFHDILTTLLGKTKSQIDGLQRELVKLDAQDREVRAEYKAGQCVEDMKLVSQRVVDAQEALESERLRAARYEKELEHLKAEADTFAKVKKIDDMFAVNPMYDALLNDIRTSMRDLASSSADLRPDHPAMKNIQKQIENSREMLKKEAVRRWSSSTVRDNPLVDDITKSIFSLKLNKAVSDIQIKFYTELIAIHEQRLLDLSTCSARLQNLNSQREAVVATMQQALKDQHRLEFVTAKPLPLFRIISYPYINHDNLGEYRYFPKRKKTVFFSAVISAFLIFFFLVGRELKENLFYFGWQLDCENRAFGCTEVPFLEPESVAGDDQYELVRSRIQDLCAAEKDASLLRIVSMRRGEGKATIALSLADYYRKLGFPCVLIDGDILGQSVSRALGVGNQQGLLDIQAGMVKIEEAVATTSSGIAILSAGRESSRKEAAGRSFRLNETVSVLNSIYSHVVYIEPPFCADYEYSLYADLLPPHDVILVAQSGAHSVRDIEYATGMYRFNSGGASLKWLVINKTPKVVDLLSPRDVYRSVTRVLRNLRSRF